MEAAIDNNYAYIIEKLDPDLIIPRMKAHLTVGGSDRYFQQVRKKGVRQKRNEDLLQIIRQHKEMWKPFISSCEDCGFDSIARVLKAGLQGKQLFLQEPRERNRNIKRSKSPVKTFTHQNGDPFAEAIDSVYAEFINTVDPTLIIPLMKASLTVGESDRYFEKLRRPELIKDEINEELLHIIRHREEMWRPFIDALDKCGYKRYAKHFEDALAKAKKSSTTNGQYRMVRSESHDTKSVELGSLSNTSLSSGKLEIIANRQVYYGQAVTSDQESLSKTGSQTNMSPDGEMMKEDNGEMMREDDGEMMREDDGEMMREDDGEMMSLQDEGRDNQSQTDEESAESGCEDRDRNGDSEEERSPSSHLLRQTEYQEDVTRNLKGVGKPDLPSKGVSGAYGGNSQNGVENEVNNFPDFDTLVDSNPNSESTLSRYAVGNLPKTLPSRLGSQSSTEYCAEKEAQGDKNGINDSHEDFIGSDQLYGPGVDQLHEDGIEKYSSKFCLSEASETPSLHERLSEEALKAQAKNKSEQSPDGEGTSQELPPAEPGEEPKFDFRGGDIWRCILRHSFLALTESLSLR